jgi:hypothetical protein
MYTEQTAVTKNCADTIAVTAIFTATKRTGRSVEKYVRQSDKSTTYSKMFQ